MELILNDSNDSFGIKIDKVSFSFIEKALRSIPDLTVITSIFNIANDEALIEFQYKGFDFSLDTPLSDYWIEKPSECPIEIFEEIKSHLHEKKFHWWNRFF